MGPIASFKACDTYYKFFQVPFGSLKGLTMVSKPSGFWALVFALREVCEALVFQILFAGSKGSIVVSEPSELWCLTSFGVCLRQLWNYLFFVSSAL